MAEEKVIVSIEAQDAATPAIEAAGEAMRRALVETPGLAQESLAALRGSIEETSTLAQESASGLASVGESVRGTLEGGLASLLETSVLEAESVGQAAEGVGKALVSSVVGGLAKMASQFLVNALLHRVAKKQEGASALSANLAAVFSGAFASTAAIPIVGPALAPAVAAASLAAATAGSAAAAGAGAAQGAALIAQEGGFVPLLPGADPNADSVLALLQPGELVVPRPFADEFSRALGGGAAGGGNVVINQSFTGPATREFVEEFLKVSNELAERFGFRVAATELV